MSTDGRIWQATTMGDFAETERRVELLCVRASSGLLDEQLRADVADVVNEGYIHALRADARGRLVGKRLDAILGDLDMPAAAREARRLRAQKQRIEESACRLRARLGVLRSVVAHVDGVRARSA
jgi:hypothetical protein